MVRTINEAYGQDTIQQNDFNNAMLFDQNDSGERDAFPLNTYAEAAYSKRNGK